MTLFTVLPMSLYTRSLTGLGRFSTLYFVYTPPPPRKFSYKDLGVLVSLDEKNFTTLKIQYFPV